MTARAVWMTLNLHTGLMFALTAACWADAAPVNFNRDVRPILSDRCFHCHGPDEHDRKAKLRLDQADGKQGSYRIHDGSQAIKPGSLKESALWHRINTDDADDVMPPEDSHKKQLTAAEKSIIKQWIKEGAEYDAFWSFKKAAIAIPQGDDKRDGSRIDHYVAARLKAVSLTASSAADKRTLLRRLTFDLTGLPPTLEELAAFDADRSSDAYETRVNALLARPQYGEHMTRYWADLVRIGDTEGLHSDPFRDFSTYRDWVIRAFNANMPYNQFVRDQLAGDLYETPTVDQQVASGFNRLNLIFRNGSVLPEEALYRNVLDRVEALGTVFLGLTVQCAQCHDHKYDPISQREFFELYAFFNNFSGEPQTSKENVKNGIQEPSIAVPVAGGSAKESEPSTTDQEGADLALGGARAMVMRERTPMRETRMRVRGAYDKFGDEVQRGTPAFLPSLKVAGNSPSRMDLANWLVSPDHPLTARVAVNRFWQQLFGVGLVKTSGDFGSQGEWPSHPQLLDYLAVRFVESGWDVKAILREIVLSETYKQTSDAPTRAYQTDPENRLLARGSRYRMDAEMIRDQMLMISGQLNTTMYGKSVKPPQPAGLWKSVSMTKEVFKADSGDAILRRSLYTFWKRIMPPPQMSIMNAPSREYCVTRRERTNTPLQALLLMNEPEYLNLARTCAVRTLRDVNNDATEALPRLYERITSHRPTQKELGTLQEALNDLEHHYGERPALAAQIAGDSENAVRTAVWTMLAHSMLNLEAAKVRR